MASVNMIFLLVSLFVSLAAFDSDPSKMKTLFNFTSENEFTQTEANLWYEVSDTVREPGKSKASFVLQKSRLFQRAIFFALLNPQPNGAGFAGVKYNLNQTLDSDSEGFEIKCRANGELKHWKLVLNVKEDSVLDTKYTYEAKFQVDTSSEEFQTIRVALTEFHAYYRGSVLLDAPPLMLDQIGIFGLQTFGGVYDEYKQIGVGSLEIDYIALF